MNLLENRSSLYKKELKIDGIIAGSVIAFIVAFYFIIPINNPKNPQTIFYQWYWLIMGIVILLMLSFFVLCLILTKKNKKNIMGIFAQNVISYGFLLKQLVSRDFKTKYKRSILGVFWSFLNPLLMMGVQYLIFSTLFGNQDIPNYPVYLLIGVILFTFMNEGSVMGLNAITGNATLLNKVPVPKRIFPLSKLLSSSINLALSFVPLIIVMACTGVVPSFAQLLFIVDYVLMFFFLYGLILFLSSIMVYFRDIQFLWGIISTVWMYATPIFYDCNAISIDWVKTAFKFNPLYHYLGFARTCLRDGACPDLMTFVYCIGFSVLMFAIGMIVFKKNEDNFVLHL